MTADWTNLLARWSAAGLIDDATAARIRTFEQEHAGSMRLRWPMLVALAFGALMIAGGILLFVAAHWDAPAQPTAVALSAVDNHLVLTIALESTGLYGRSAQRDGRTVAVLDEPLAYFIPEHVPDPSRRPAGEELWVELTLPRHGMPRPIRLGVKKNDRLTPLDLR
jgi:hypothetical protein